MEPKKYPGHNALTFKGRVSAWERANKQGPRGATGPTLMKESRRIAGIRHILKTNPERLQDMQLVQAIRNGVATRHMIYGGHPTKGGKGRNRR